ncbi:hypothetical protein RBWH47_05235 [Rhodopirellula baltica WH47]|uniref:Uncharacterized protein n=1 Tax=Rhodopirellula baltica WH47 TaxID=991778 RepID=F2AVE2_RHOBT|nr:hypothetical protein RBWH47_05235 [Rhodopirellula baltica WH47]
MASNQPQQINSLLAPVVQDNRTCVFHTSNPTTLEETSDKIT